MPFIYCQSCGTKLEFTTKRPNFCNHCGSSLNSSVAKVSQASSATKENVQSSEDPQTCPEISGLQVDISRPHHEEITLGNTLGSGALSGSLKRRAYEVKGDSVLKDSIELCKSSKSKDIDASGRKE
jgi:hypothetical protein